MAGGEKRDKNTNIWWIRLVWDIITLFTHLHTHTPPTHTSDPLPTFTHSSLTQLPHTPPSHTPPSHPSFTHTSLTQVLMTYLHSMLHTCSFETQSPSLQRNWSRAWKMNQTTLRSVRAHKLREAVPTLLDSIYQLSFCYVNILHLSSH